jgi:hypothetical protein
LTETRNKKRYSATLSLIEDEEETFDSLDSTKKKKHASSPDKLEDSDVILFNITLAPK